MTASMDGQMRGGKWVFFSGSPVTDGTVWRKVLETEAWS